jgi:hypothetical protein
MKSITKAIVFLACLFVAGVQSTYAVNITWDAGGDPDRDWGTAANWSSDIEPAAADHVFIGNSYTGVVTTAGRVGANVNIGFGAATGTLLQTGGSLSVSNFVVGSSTNSSGAYAVSDGSLTVAVRMVVGASGAATVTVDGVNAGIVVGENIYVAMSNANNRAAMYQGAGSVVASNIYLGGNNTTAAEGKYSITGGTLSVLSTIFMAAFNVNSTGRLDIAGGSVNATAINIGRNGLGMLRVSGSGNINVSSGAADILVGDIGSASNTMEVSDYAMVGIADDLILANSGSGANGILRIKDNALVSVGNEIVIARVANTTGRVDMTGGRLVTTNGAMTVGNGGIGSCYVSGTATVDLNGANGDLVVGSTTAASNILEISGSGAVEVNDELLMCSGSDSARGYIKIKDNGKLIVGRNLLMAQRPSAFAELLMEGGTMTVTSLFFVGNASNAIGHVKINGGGVTTLTHMALGKVAHATGIVTMTGGIIKVGGQLEVGNLGQGYVQISGGELTTGGGLYIPMAGPEGIFEVIGSLPSITIGSTNTNDMAINSNGHLKVTFFGGAIAPILVQDDIIINTNATLSIDAIGAVANGTYVIATSLNSSAVSGAFLNTNWLGGLAGTVSYTNRSIQVTISGAVATPYETWASSYGLAGGDASPTNDPDNDSWYNQLEYGFGGNPTNNSDTGVFPTWGLKAGTLEVVYRRRLDAVTRGLTYQVQAESNVLTGAWSTNDTLEVGASVIDADFESVTNRILGGSTTFGRVEVGLEE